MTLTRKILTTVYAVSIAYGLFNIDDGMVSLISVLLFGTPLYIFLYKLWK